MMMPPSAQARLIALLESEGRGRENAIRLPDLAARLGLKVREVQALAAQAVEAGILVGSSCSGRSGLFLVESEGDLEEASRHVRARALSSLKRVATLRRAAEQRFAEATVQRLFDLEAS